MTLSGLSMTLSGLMTWQYDDWEKYNYNIQWVASKQVIQIDTGTENIYGHTT